MWGWGEEPPSLANARWALSTEEPVPELSSMPPPLVETSPLLPRLETITTERFAVTLAPQPLLPGAGRPVPCGPHEAACHSGHCIPRDYVCDGQDDCKDGSDELDCGEEQAGCSELKGRGSGQGRATAEPCSAHPGPTPPCEPNEFPCGNGHCALKLWHCDGDFDCEDRTDEANCRECPGSMWPLPIPSRAGVSAPPWPSVKALGANFSS